MPYPLHKAPSQRFRVEAYFNLLKEQNIDYDTQQFLDDAAWQVLYLRGSLVKKVTAVCKEDAITNNYGGEGNIT